jgi:hypothetical protein
MEAIAKMIMIAPGAWDLEIVTDSESAINKLEGGSTGNKGGEWQLVRRIEQMRKQRKGKIILTHQNSHKQLDTANSVGNATADLVADRYTWQTDSWRKVKEITKLHNEDRVAIMNGRNGKWITGDLRQEMRQRLAEEAEQTWTADSSQGKIRGEISELRKYIRARKKRTGGKHMDTITKLLTTVHTQEPRLGKSEKGAGKCDFCRIVRGKEEKRDPEHEASCRVDMVVDREQIEEMKEKARETVRPEFPEQRKEQDALKGEVDMLIRGLELQKQGEHIYVRIGGNTQKAPGMNALKALAEDYLIKTAANGLEKPGSQGEGWRSELKGELKRGYGQIRGGDLRKEDWGRIVSIFQITKQHGKPDERVREYLKGDTEEGNGIWTTGVAHEKKLQDMIGRKKWLVVVTKNTSQNKKVLKRCGLEQFATDKKRHALIAIHIPKGTEIGETERWVRTMDKIQKWNELKHIEIKTDNFERIAGTILMQASDWKSERKKEIEKGLDWIDDKDKRNGIVTDKDIDTMKRVGISRRSARKIAREVEDVLFQLYTEDIRLKRKMCKNKRIEEEKVEKVERERIYKEKKNKREQDRQGKKGKGKKRKKRAENKVERAERKEEGEEETKWTEIRGKAQRREGRLKKRRREEEGENKAKGAESKKRKKWKTRKEQEKQEEIGERLEKVEMRQRNADERQERTERRQKEIDERWKG